VFIAKQAEHLCGDGGKQSLARSGIIFSSRIGLYITLDPRFYGSRESANVLDELLGIRVAMGKRKGLNSW